MSNHKQSPVAVANPPATAARSVTGEASSLWRKLTKSAYGQEHLKSHEVTFILRNLSTLVSNGVSLPKALGTLAREDTLARHHGLLDSLRRKVEAGVSFSDALTQTPNFCDQLTINQLRVGERSGTLAETLGHLAYNRGKSAELKRTIVRKIAYPTMLVVLGSALVTFLLLYVVPVFQKTYEQANVPLPLITRVLIQTAAAVQSYGWLVVAAAVLLAAGLKQLRKREEFALRIDETVLRLPLVGSWLRDIAVLQLMEVLHSLMAAGYTLAEAVKQTAESVGNRAVRQGVHDLQLAVYRGERFSRELERHEGMFPPIVNQLVIVGENTGQLTKATYDICDFLREEIERKTSLMVSSLEPVLTISLAVAIAVVLLAIYLPMFDMVNTLS